MLQTGFVGAESQTKHVQLVAAGFLQMKCHSSSQMLS